ncbi:MAG: hypothetical protein PVI91_10885 [Gammaproteobacteria bacterium]|jgi:proline iminopeptidase
MAQAHPLYRAWPDARLEVIEDAGHSAGGPGMVDPLVQATGDFAGRLA